MTAVEGDLLKTEDEFESLEKRYSNEQERAKVLMEELEISRKELSKYQLAEKEESNQEHILYKRLKEEEAKSSHLTREVEALKRRSTSTWAQRNPSAASKQTTRPYRETHPARGQETKSWEERWRALHVNSRDTAASVRV